jgi:hypothetical protein
MARSAALSAVRGHAQREHLRRQHNAGAVRLNGHIVPPFMPGGRVTCLICTDTRLQGKVTEMCAATCRRALMAGYREVAL